MTSDFLFLFFSVNSFGIVLSEILTRRLPFEDVDFKNRFEIQDMVLQGMRPTIPYDCPPRYKKLMERCWSDDPSNRPDFQEIVSSLENQLECSRLPRDIDPDYT